MTIYVTSFYGYVSPSLHQLLYMANFFIFLFFQYIYHFLWACTTSRNPH